MKTPTAAFGSRGIITLLGMMIIVALWMATERTARVDDTANQSIALPLPDMRIDLNTAGTAELSVLPGLGPALAARIVEYRQQHGPFGSVESLDRVPGIGASILDRVRPFACVGPVER